jgi:hypothetical protein
MTEGNGKCAWDKVVQSFRVSSGETRHFPEKKEGVKRIPANHDFGYVLPSIFNNCHLGTAAKHLPQFRYLEMWKVRAMSVPADLVSSSARYYLSTKV